MEITIAYGRRSSVPAGDARGKGRLDFDAKCKGTSRSGVRKTREQRKASGGPRAGRALRCVDGLLGASLQGSHNRN